MARRRENRRGTFLLETCPSVSDRRLQKQVHAHVLVIATAFLYNNLYMRRYQLYQPNLYIATFQKLPATDSINSCIPHRFGQQHPSKLSLGWLAHSVIRFLRGPFIESLLNVLVLHKYNRQSDSLVYHRDLIYLFGISIFLDFIKKNLH